MFLPGVFFMQEQIDRGQLPLVQLKTSLLTG